jgi:hypothetical protein
MWYPFLFAVSVLAISSGCKYDVNITFCTCYVITDSEPISQPSFCIMLYILDKFIIIYLYVCIHLLFII